MSRTTATKLLVALSAIALSSPAFAGQERLDLRQTYVQDVPWDWAHRFPPAVAPSDRPYVPACATERSVVPGRGGTAHVVDVTRCR